MGWRFACRVGGQILNFFATQSFTDSLLLDRSFSKKTRGVSPGQVIFRDKFFTTQSFADPLLSSPGQVIEQKFGWGGGTNFSGWADGWAEPIFGWAPAHPCPPIGAVPGITFYF